MLWTSTWDPTWTLGTGHETVQIVLNQTEHAGQFLPDKPASVFLKLDLTRDSSILSIFEWRPPLSSPDRNEGLGNQLFHLLCYQQPPSQQKSSRHFFRYVSRKYSEQPQKSSHISASLHLLNRLNTPEADIFVPRNVPVQQKNVLLQVLLHNFARSTCTHLHPPPPQTPSPPLICPFCLCLLGPEWMNPQTFIEWVFWTYREVWGLLESPSPFFSLQGA